MFQERQQMESFFQSQGGEFNCGKIEEDPIFILNKERFKREDAVLGEEEEKLEKAKNKYKNLDVSEIKDLGVFLQGKDYFEQFAILEKAVNNGVVKPDELFNLFYNSENLPEEVAIIENMPNFKDEHDEEKCAEFLKDIAVNYFDDKNIKEYFRDFKISIDNKYLTDWEQLNERYDIIITAAIKNLARFKDKGEEMIIGVFKENQEKNKFDKIYKDPKIKVEKIVDKEDHGDYLEDEEGDLAFSDLRDCADISYHYNSLCLKELNEIGTRKSIDFAAEFLAKDSSATFIYKDEIVEIFKNIDVPYSLEKLFDLMQTGDQEAKERAAKCICRLGVRDVLEKNSSEEETFAEEYPSILMKVNNIAREAAEIYNSMFPDNMMSEYQAVKIMLIKAIGLLSENMAKLKGSERSVQKKLIEEIINNFKKEFELKKKSLKDFKKMAEQINKYLYYGARGEISSIVFENLLKYRTNFEKKFEEIIFGKESAELPEDIRFSVEERIREYEPEIKKGDDKEFYLPVGVSSNLPSEEEFRAKPIDALCYLFWMENQGKKIDFMVCDTIQETNYRALYGLEPDAAREKAMENGRRDKEWYEAVKNVFGLDNINIKNYQELEQSSIMKEKSELLDKLEKENPIFAKTFERVIEGSVREKADKKGKGNLELLKKYGKTEIAFILAENEVKIGHKKEFRYDILSKVIPIYEELKKHIEEIPELKNADNKNKVLMELTVYLAHQHNFPPFYHLAIDLFANKEKQNKIALELKQKPDMDNKETRQIIKELKISAKALQGKIQEEVKKFQEEKRIIDEVEKNLKSLGLSENPKEAAVRWREAGKSIAEKEWFKKIKLPDFYYPESMANLSFEMRDKENKEVTGWREFYSTYKGETEEEAALSANQVIASTNPMSAAKLLVLSNENQRLYAEKVIEPLLANYYLATSKSKDKAIARMRDDMKEVETISDAIGLIQQKIIWPIEMETKNRSTQEAHQN